ncbi:MAG: hypothetical protein KGS61_18910 [Verrucomicrobia bacterium]|nr:hypothetical protein [Verrucomicrobiota bacterium]
MKLIKLLTIPVLAVAVLAVPLSARAGDDAGKKLKPYPLKTCVVSGEKLGGDMGDPYVFSYQGREIKLCCKDCLKKFNKDPKAYLKKIEAAEKKGKN